LNEGSQSGENRHIRRTYTIAFNNTDFEAGQSTRGGAELVIDSQDVADIIEKFQYLYSADKRHPLETEDQVRSRIANTLRDEYIQQLQQKHHRSAQNKQEPDQDPKQQSPDQIEQPRLLTNEDRSNRLRESLHIFLQRKRAEKKIEEQLNTERRN
jgi:hypothetical protein